MALSSSLRSRTMDMPRPPPPMAALMMSGIAVFLGEEQGVLLALHRVRGAGDDGHAGLDGDGAGGDLVAHGVQGFRGGADEGDAGLAAGAGEVGVLGEEAVAGVDGVHPLVHGQLHDFVDGQVGAHRASCPRR